MKIKKNRLILMFLLCIGLMFSLASCDALFSKDISFRVANYTSGSISVKAGDDGSWQTIYSGYYRSYTEKDGITFYYKYNGTTYKFYPSDDKDYRIYGGYHTYGDYGTLF